MYVYIYICMCIYIYMYVYIYIYLYVCLAEHLWETHSTKPLLGARCFRLISDVHSTLLGSGKYRGTGSMHSWSKARSALDLNAWAKEPL